MIAIGILKLGEEFGSNEIKDRHENFTDSMRYLNHVVDNTSALHTRTNERHDNRFHRLDVKRADLEKKIGDNYDSLAKKIIQQENKLNDVTKAVVEIAKRHDALVRDTTRELKKLENLKERTAKMSKKLGRLQQKALKTKKAKK